MQPEDRDWAYLWDMREACQEISDFISGRSLEQFQNDKMLRRAVDPSLEKVDRRVGGKRSGRKLMSRPARAGRGWSAYRRIG